MSHLRFDWDVNKERSNRLKHGISFEEARSVFYDERALEYDDPDHSDSEDRFLMIGMSERLRVLVVCHCLREAGEVIRIISARRATQSEARHYEEETA